MTPAREGDGDGRTMADWENRLCGGPSGEVFSSAELEGLPEPVRRYPRTAIVPGTPLAVFARLRMRGRIKPAVGCRFRPARRSTRTRVSSGPPVRQESLQAPTGISTGQAPWTGSSRAWSPSRTRMGPRCPRARLAELAAKGSGCRQPCCPAPALPGPPPMRATSPRLHLGPAPVEINLDLDPGAGSGRWSSIGGAIPTRPNRGHGIL